MFGKYCICPTHTDQLVHSYQANDRKNPPRIEYIHNRMHTQRTGYHTRASRSTRVCRLQAKATPTRHSAHGNPGRIPNISLPATYFRIYDETTRKPDMNLIQWIPSNTKCSQIQKITRRHTEVVCILQRSKRTLLV